MDGAIAMRKSVFAAMAALCCLTAAAQSEGGACQQEFAAALVPSVQTPAAGADVTLARVALVCGSHRNVYGLDFSVLGTLVEDDMVGFAFSGVFNVIGRSRSAVQIAGLFDSARGDFTGLQLTAGANLVQGTFRGLQIGSANVCDGLCGMQFGVFNKARAGVGLQLGGVNVSERFTGVQLGLVNLNLDSSVPMVPILNCYF